MTALIIILAVLFIIALIPLGIKARYDENGPVIWAKVGIISIKLYPVKEKDKKPKKKKAKKKKEVKTPEQTAKTGGNTEMLKQLIFHSLKAGKRFDNGLSIDRLTVYYQCAAGDAAKTAIQYGYGWAAVGMVTSAVENLFTVKDRDLQVFADFDDDAEPKIYVLAQLTVRVWRLVCIGVYFAVSFLKIAYSNKKNTQIIRKGE